MRKIGQALRVEAMSLYEHIAGKEDVLDGLVDLVMAEIELPGTTSTGDQRSGKPRYPYTKHYCAAGGPLPCSSRDSRPVRRGFTTSMADRRPAPGRFLTP